jgi:ABC-2 type transport system permease protein
MNRSIVTLARIEAKLSLRSMDMVLFGLLMPLAIIILIGLIYDDHGSQSGMISTSFGAFISIGLCAVGLMGLPLTIADYRHKKILKRLAVTPAHPALLLGVQVLVQSVVAIFSALMVTIAAVLFFDYRPIGAIPALIGGYLVVLMMVFSIGMCVASVAPDIKKAGLICSILYFPMLIFSGTTVPFSVFPVPVQRVASWLPLTQGIKLLNSISSGEPFQNYYWRGLVLLALTLVCTLVSIRSFRWDME